MSSSSPQPPHGTVRYDTNSFGDGDVATITLSRPESLNSMTSELMSDISAAFANVSADSSVRAVVLTGEGRGFCSGADLRNATTDNANAGSTEVEAGGGAAELSEGEITTQEMDDSFNPAIRDVSQCPVPTVARINGVTAGGGIGLALACDVAIAARSAFFVATFGPRLGIVPDLGTTWQLPQRIGRARSLGMSLLGDRITADQAANWGLVWSTVEDAELDSAVSQVIDVLRRSSPAATSRIREAVDGAIHHTLSEQLDVEMGHQAVLIPRNMGEAAEAFLAKAEPSFKPDRF